ncbi:MAG: hypothetical protein OHK0019_29320 [Saprospiraceae bacterium]
MVGLTWSAQHDPFFWDTVQLASKHAHHFYENGLRWLPLPEEIDSGHPPVFGYYLAHIWSFFGKTLPVSHWAMLPFLLLNVWLLYRLGLRLGTEKWAFWLIPLVLLDPVMAGQSVLVSPDIVLACGFLFAVEGILERNKFFTAIGILLLCIVSIRGMMTAGALFAWQLTLFLRRDRTKNRGWASTLIKNAMFFLPGFAFAAWFLWWHRTATGWSGFHPNSPWSPAFEPVGGVELCRNLLVIGWRWLDFGRVFEWLLLGWLVWKNQPFKNANPAILDLLLLLGCLVIFLSPSALFFKNISAHRYFLPAFLALHFLVYHLWANALPVLKFKKEWLFSALITALALGNLWIYPRGVSMGWDATLAHLPYHTLRAEAVVFFQKNNIDFQKAGSFFPNLNTGENLSLDGDSRHFAEKDFSRNEYVLASNIFNDLSETDYTILQRDWILLKKWKHAGVWIEIYQRP